MVEELRKMLNQNKKYFYLVFSRTGTLFSKLINFGLSNKYAHVSISFDSHLDKMYSFGRLNPDNPFLAGLIEENIHDGIFKKFPYSECLVYKVSITPKQYDLLKNEVNTFWQEKEKYRYNFIGVFTAYWDMPLERTYHYFCSQFVSELLIKSQIYDSNKSTALISPTDLLEIENKKFIYEGLIKDYSEFLSTSLAYN